MLYEAQHYFAFFFQLFLTVWRFEFLDLTLKPHETNFVYNQREVILLSISSNY